MIDEKRYTAWFRKETILSMDEMAAALDEKFTCPRCGRPDLPLALFPHHNKSCAFKCAIGMPAIEKIEELERRISDLEYDLSMTREFRCMRCLGVFDMEHYDHGDCVWCAKGRRRLW